MNDIVSSCRHFLALSWALMFFATQHLSAKEPVSYRQSEDLSAVERQSLTRKAERGDVDAAFALARYHATIAPDLKKREHFLTLAAATGSREATESLADFYSMPRGIFRLQKAIRLRETLKRNYPRQTDNAQWAESSAFEYHYIDGEDARRKELMFLRLAASWGSDKAMKALKGRSIDGFPVPVVRDGN
jgi:TPR repeat protein